jgi:hypothetical protein
MSVSVEYVTLHAIDAQPAGLEFAWEAFDNATHG